MILPEIFISWKPAACRSADCHELVHVYCNDVFDELANIDEDNAITVLIWSQLPDGVDVRGIYLGKKFRLHLHAAE